MRLALDAVETSRSFDPGWSLPTGGFEGHLAPWDAFWGPRYAIVHDPDGNSIDPFAPLGG